MGNGQQKPGLEAWHTVEGEILAAEGALHFIAVMSEEGPAPGAIWTSR
ncbi:MAG: hypothetical protein QOE72_3250 [Chloroflexota bacterium]|jgi:hypothetical protein|nr:hypothetical protein [Chloroflexota bacterium]